MTALNAITSAVAALDVREATNQKRAQTGVEQMFLQELLKAGGAFSSSDMPGAAQLNDLITETLASVLAESGTLGVAERLLGEAGPARPAPTRESALALAAPRDAGPGFDVTSLVEHAGARVSSAFGHRHDPLTGESRFHHGVDVAAPEGSPVKAALAGRVVFAGARGGYGNVVEIEHEDGRTSRYAHLSAIAVEPGDAIAAGARLGAVGSTGRSTGPHLHFELRNKGLAADPAQALQKYRVGVDVVGESPFGAASPGGQR